MSRVWNCTQMVINKKNSSIFLCIFNIIFVYLDVKRVELHSNGNKYEE